MLPSSLLNKKAGRINSRDTRSFPLHEAGMTFLSRHPKAASRGFLALFES
jgi:hypothetical protein